MSYFDFLLNWILQLEFALLPGKIYYAWFVEEHLAKLDDSFEDIWHPSADTINGSLLLEIRIQPFFIRSPIITIRIVHRIEMSNLFEYITIFTYSNHLV